MRSSASADVRVIGFSTRTCLPWSKAKLRDDRAPATHTVDVWAMDFVHDQLAMGSKIRILTVIDTFSRYAQVGAQVTSAQALLEVVASDSIRAGPIGIIQQEASSYETELKKN